MAAVLGADMLTLEEEPVIIVPGCEYSAGSGYEGHEFFEAPSIRRVDDKYYFVYSSIVMHELCYAVSSKPREGFEYAGVIVSNCDLHIDFYKPAERPMAYGANNHGGIEKINGEWYIFYHRHTNGTWFSRQGCAERLSFLPDGHIPQVEMTSCGLNGGALEGRGFYPAYIACNLFNEIPAAYVGDSQYPELGGGHFPKITQDDREESAYIANMRNQATAGFKYFYCENISRIHILTRGYAKGRFEVRTMWYDEVLAEIPIEYSNVWEKNGSSIKIPDGTTALYLTYRGEGSASLLGFELV